MLANFYLFSYELEFMMKLMAAKRWALAERFLYTKRYIDDIGSFNNNKFADRRYQQHNKIGIYPRQYLTLNEEQPPKHGPGRLLDLYITTDDKRCWYRTNAVTTAQDTRPRAGLRFPAVDTLLADRSKYGGGRALPALQHAGAHVRAAGGGHGHGHEAARVQHGQGGDKGTGSGGTGVSGLPRCREEADPRGMAARGRGDTETSKGSGVTRQPRATRKHAHSAAHTYTTRTHARSRETAHTIRAHTIGERGHAAAAPTSAGQFWCVRDPPDLAVTTAGPVPTVPNATGGAPGGPVQPAGVPVCPTRTAGSR